MIILWVFFLISLVIYITNDTILIEQYSNQPRLIILMGDSILDNKIYVEKSIVNYIEEHISDGDDTLHCIAKDNSTIQDVVDNQLPQLNQGINNKQTYIFISVGGNDILQQIVYRNAHQLNPVTFEKIISTYEDCVKHLTNQMNKSNIILLTLYYPQSIFYKKYVSIIQSWNIRVKETAKKYNCSVLDLSDFMNNSNDFSYGIEPSDIGGKKIVDNIMKFF